MINMNPFLYFVFGFITCCLFALLLDCIDDNYDDDLNDYNKEDDWNDFSKKEKKERRKTNK